MFKCGFKILPLYAGIGAAWKWQGESGKALDEAAVKSMQQFLSESQPRIRALGGARFHCTQACSEEWESFGSYLFMIPRSTSSPLKQPLPKYADVLP